jgi:hypothetical protein
MRRETPLHSPPSASIHPKVMRQVRASGEAGAADGTREAPTACIRYEYEQYSTWGGLTSHSRGCKALAGAMPAGGRPAPRASLVPASARPFRCSSTMTVVFMIVTDSSGPRPWAL